MAEKIHQDHSRFRQIVRGKIKKDLRKYMSHGEMIGRQGKRSVVSPTGSSPRFSRKSFPWPLPASTKTKSPARFNSMAPIPAHWARPLRFSSPSRESTTST